MDSGKKKTLILILGVAGGITLAAILGFALKIFFFIGVGEALKSENEKTKAELQAKIEARKQRDLAKLIYQKENSNECRFWRQQLKHSPKAVSKIREYCYYGPEHAELPHPNSDKIWKSD